MRLSRRSHPGGRAIGAALLAIVCAAGARAQSSTTAIDLGGGLTHVDALGPDGTLRSSDCMTLTGGMATCHSVGTSRPMPPRPAATRPQAGGTPSSFIDSLAVRSRDRSTRRAIGEKLAAGDCPAAAALASADHDAAKVEQVHRACPAAAAPPFNLSCTGVETRLTATGMEETPFARVYRIDIGARRYCDGACDATVPIADVQPTRITLSDNIAPDGTGSEQSISRETGGLSGSAMRRGEFPHFIKARCERQPFTGFPPLRF